MNRREELQKILEDARHELFEITDKEKYEKNVVLLNKCYRYHNSYSCPITDDDYWWMYEKIIGIDEYGNLKTFIFQTDDNGNITIDNNCSFWDVGKEEINSKEFDNEWDNLLTKIRNIKV